MGGSILIRDMLQICLYPPTTGYGREHLDKRHVTELPLPTNLCTDENDLNFDDLSNFGPRFRKLADMYGEDPSDEEEEENFHNAASESWC
uniref:(California timema) hypothetical protein n=1 Tax=Timema californicum TaxID=61474 RepID=A0A7R9JBW8_TIMCA|nr:unnamed protein product [Timema californicum]